MKYQYEVTVIVGTYNPNWKKLKATLYSIVNQKNVQLQIVISDDGSTNPLFMEITSFFEEVGFINYKLVKGEKNEGTVCQFYRGLCAADAAYVKLISPGDLLYDDTVLLNWLIFTKEYNADITFGDAVFYNIKNDSFKIIKHYHNPRNLKIYKAASSYHEKVINYLCLGDGISGAAILAKKDILLYYIKFLLHRVIYVEDFFIRLAVLDERKIVYYPSKVIWYEFADGGVSTSGNEIWEKRIKKDNIAMDEICIEKCVKRDVEIFSWLLDNLEFKKIEQPTRFNKIVRYFQHPKWLYWRIYAVLFGEYSPTEADETFLIYCFKNN